jgi:hypothetical protein
MTLIDSKVDAAQESKSNRSSSGSLRLKNSFQLDYF